MTFSYASPNIMRRADPALVCAMMVQSLRAWLRTGMDSSDWLSVCKRSIMRWSPSGAERIWEWRRWVLESVNLDRICMAHVLA
mmetsp:Transcript_15023/g.22495  ORF Transcript_15023/g.22495 Transcript_15023/m.22495 type:complete len:83 (+) Transcript_15023:279-527(+)